MVEVYIVLLHKVQLHVLALDNGHLQVVLEILSKQLYGLLWAVYSGTVQEVRWARDLICIMKVGRCPTHLLYCTTVYSP